MSAKRQHTRTLTILYTGITGGIATVQISETGRMDAEYVFVRQGGAEFTASKLGGETYEMDTASGKCSCKHGKAVAAGMRGFKVCRHVAAGRVLAARGVV